MSAQTNSFPSRNSVSSRDSLPNNSNCAGGGSAFSNRNCVDEGYVSFNSNCAGGGSVSLEDDPSNWECEVCTTSNNKEMPFCEICETMKGYRKVEFFLPGESNPIDAKKSRIGERSSEDGKLFFDSKKQEDGTQMIVRLRHFSEEGAEQPTIEFYLFFDRKKTQIGQDAEKAFNTMRYICYNKCKITATYFDVYTVGKDATGEEFYIRYIFRTNLRNFRKVLTITGAKIYLMFETSVVHKSLLSEGDKLVNTFDEHNIHIGKITEVKNYLPEFCEVPTQDPEKSNTDSSSSSASNSSSSDSVISNSNNSNTNSSISLASNVGSTVSVTSNSNNSNTDNLTLRISNSNNTTIIVASGSLMGNLAETLISGQSSSSSDTRNSNVPVEKSKGSFSDDESEAGPEDEPEAGSEDEPNIDSSTPIPTNNQQDIVNNINTLVTQIGSSSPCGSSDGESVGVTTVEIDSSSHTVTKGEKVMFISAVLVLLIAAGSAFL
jgi:hypothetical protein